MTQLASCPFCGNTNVTASEAADDDRSWLVACDAKSRACPMEVRVIECFSEEQAIAAWNRRSSTPTRAATDAEALARRIVLAMHDDFDDEQGASDRDAIHARYRELKTQVGSYVEARYQARVGFVASLLAAALPSSRALSEDQIEALKIAIDTFGNGRSRVDHRVANRLGELLDRLTGAPK